MIIDDYKKLTINSFDEESEFDDEENEEKEDGTLNDDALEGEDDVLDLPEDPDEGFDDMNLGDDGDY